MLQQHTGQLMAAGAHDARIPSLRRGKFALLP
jgi:hypothetical protein